jgi:hypothetical protein
VVISVVYLLVRCLTVLSRGHASKDAELLVLRHENAVLRRQAGRVRYEPGERLWLAALSRLVPRRRWGDVFPVTPATTAFFGPVISRLPSAAEAVPLWDNVLGLASFPSFAELKRSLRERPQLRSFGVDPGQAGVQEDWYAGSRRAPG